jgi:hypothetical protein
MLCFHPSDATMESRLCLLRHGARLIGAACVSRKDIHMPVSHSTISPLHQPSESLHHPRSSLFVSASLDTAHCAKPDVHRIPPPVPPPPPTFTSNENATPTHPPPPPRHLPKPRLRLAPDPQATRRRPRRRRNRLARSTPRGRARLKPSPSERPSLLAQKTSRRQTDCSVLIEIDDGWHGRAGRDWCALSGVLRRSDDDDHDDGEDRCEGRCWR